MVGQTWLDDLDDESHWQIGVGYQFDNPWAVELTYSALDTESTSDVPAIKTDVTRWHVDALYHLEAMGKVRPYLASVTPNMISPGWIMTSVFLTQGSV